MKILKNGDVLRFGPELEVQSQLEKGVYIVGQDMNGFFLTRKPDLTLPAKVYGDHSVVDRWLKSFEYNTSKNMGILLNGLKGTGKTITAQILCVKSELPIILIDQPYGGPDFMNFITNPLIGKCVIFIDEFEKVYRESDERSSQEGLLQLMDGAYQTRFLFLLTSNEPRINKFLINRLGRIKYRQNYNELPKDIMLSVIDDMLVRPEHRQSIIDFFERFDMCTYDILVNMIKEVNLFNENAFTCAKYLNLEPEDRSYTVKAIYNGVEYFAYTNGFSPLKSETCTVRISDHKAEKLISLQNKKINAIIGAKAALLDEKVSDHGYDLEEDEEDEEMYESGYTSAQLAVLMANGVDIKGRLKYNYEIDFSKTPLVKTENGYILEIPEQKITFIFKPYAYTSYFSQLA